MENKTSRLDGASTSRSYEAESTHEEIQKMSDALYIFHEPKPANSANLDIFFFHGLECEGVHVPDAHIRTWRVTGGEEEIWPQKWLAEDFPQARIISVLYDGCPKQTETEGKMDLYLIGENLVQEIGWAREHCPDRPVILVGHGFGGIVFKNLCVNAQFKQKEKSVMGKYMEMLLESIRGFFFYSTPHLGIEGLGPPGVNEGSLLRWVRLLNLESVRLHEAFCSMWMARRYRWTIYGLGEVESTLERHGFRVPEASTRFGDNFMTVLGDHFSVCRPSDRTDNRYRHLQNLIGDVQRQVELEMKSPLLVPEVTVGVDGLLTEILGKHIRDHRFVGFFGMGGVGKTTLAKLVFNRIYAKFEFSCFVEEIKQLSGTRDEIRKKIWEKVRRHGVPVCSASGSSGTDGWYQVTGRSLLVVFDDVQDTDHVKLLKEIAHDNGVGESRFILTSRDINRLRDCGPEYKIHVCRLDGLDFEDANKLFIIYAFPGQQEPPKSLRRVVKQVVDGCEGLPLTLEVLGNYLREKDIEHWEEIPTVLKECDQVGDLEEKVWAKLQLSYDRLPGNEVKCMFLEIASFFIFDSVVHMFPVDDVILAWTSIYGIGRSRLQTLEDRALVRIWHYKDFRGHDRKGFYMHEHLRKMGQRIAKVEGRSFDLSRVQLSASTYWIPEGKVHNLYPLDDQVIFQGDQELGKIVAHRILINKNSAWVFGQNCAFCIMRELCNKLTAIRYMELSMDIQGGIFHCCQKCRNRECPLPNTLVLFRFVGSGCADFVISGGGRNYPGGTRETLVLTTSSLVKLHLEGCQNVDLGGLNKLPRLRTLEISSCEAVRNWPTSLRELTNLKRLELYSIHEPFELSSSLVDLINLEHLSITECQVSSVPSSLQNLISLRVLEVSKLVGRQAMPDIRFLRQIEKLHLKCWGIVNLVEVLREMTALRKLTLKCEGIEELPDTLGHVTNLEELQLKCPIEWLPASFANLTRLEKLKLDGRFGMVKSWMAPCHVRLREDEIVRPVYPLFQHLQGFMTKQKRLSLNCQHGTSVAVIVRNMISLESLEIKVRGPQAVPDDFGDLQKLRIFKLTCKAMESRLVESLERLSSLEKLDLVCETVEQLPDVFGCFSTLKTLRIECRSLQALPDTIGNFIQLTTLSICATGLRALPDSFARLPQLEEFCLTGCGTLTTFPDLVGCSSSLVRLRLGAWEISRVPPQAMWQLPRLKELEIWGSSTESHRLDHLEHLPETIWQMPHLESLSLLNLQKLTTLPEALGNLHSLRKLQCERCALESLPESLGRLSGLIHLTVRECRDLKTLPETIGGLSRLTFLNLSNNSALHSLPESLGRLSCLRRLVIGLCKSLKTLPDAIGNLSSLRCLYVSASTLPSPPHSFWGLSKLEKLFIQDSENLKFPLETMKDLLPGTKKIFFLEQGSTGH